MFLAPELATRTGHQDCVLAPELVGHHNGVLAPETATATALRHPTWSPVRCFGTRGGHQNGGATSELAWEGRLEVRNGRILVKVVISRGGVTSNFGRITPHQALMHIVNPRPFLRGGGGVLRQIWLRAWDERGGVRGRGRGGGMVPRGLEPRTLRLLAVRSSQLSYETSRPMHG